MRNLLKPKLLRLGWRSGAHVGTVKTLISHLSALVVDLTSCSSEIKTLIAHLAAFDFRLLGLVLVFGCADLDLFWFRVFGMGFSD